MSAARPVFKGVNLMLTRRIRGRVFLLRPSPRTNQVVGYVLAVMQKKHNILVHSVKVMSNHWHVVLTDPDGNIVGFQRDCHQFIARGLNAHHGEFESIWASGQGSRVEDELPEDVIGQIAYAMANAVEAGLVRYGRSWPGIRMAWPAKPKVYKRPPKFFRGEEEGGSWPAEATLEMSRPPGYDDLSDDELAAVVNAAIEAREEEFRVKHDREGRRFLGRKQVLAQSRHHTPATREPRFGISPKVACKDKWRRIERLRRNKQWLADYREALARWRAGDRDVIFPAGTYQMRVLHGVRCADDPV